MSLFSAVIDAIMGNDEQIGGMPFTRLTAQLSATETATATVESTVGFGEWDDGTGDRVLLVGAELIYATAAGSTTTFTTLTRGYKNTEAVVHEPGTLVFDFSQNTSALDHVRRGMLVDFAVGEDLDTIGRNLGLNRCPGLTEDEWRDIIRNVAYLPKGTTNAFEVALDVLWGSNYSLRENHEGDPWKVFVEVVVTLATSLQGRFMLNSGELQTTTTTTTVDVDYNPASPTLGTYAGSASQVLGARTYAYPAGAIGTAICGVYLDTPEARRGYRDGLTNYFLPGGSVLGNTITLGTAVPGANTDVIVDYTAFSAHYLAENETTLHDADFYAYLADPLLATRCLMEQVRAAGISVEVGVGS